MWPLSLRASPFFLYWPSFRSSRPACRFTAKLGLGIAVGLLIALWSAGAGIRAIMRAMNIAYGERETRNLATFYALAASMTLSMILFVWIALAVIIGVPAILHLLKLDGAVAIFSRFLPWVLLVSMFGFAAGVLYRFGPSRRPAKKRWVFPGIVFTTVTKWNAIRQLIQRAGQTDR